MAKLMGWAIFLILFGLGSFILPLLGLQFKLFMLFELLLGGYSWVASLICIIAGIVLIVVGLKKHAPN